MFRALINLANRESLVSDPDYEFKAVAWIVPVSESGELLPFRPTREALPAVGKKKPRVVVKSFRVPRQPGRTSGDFAFFLCDKAEYVFGIMPNATNITGRSAEKLADRSALFRERVRACHDVTGDEGVRALLGALDDVADGRQRVELPVDCAANDLFVFVYAPDGDILLHDRPLVRQYWASERSRELREGAAQFQCTVTGNAMSSPANFPKVKRVPGGTSSGVALVSFNAPAFESYGFSSNENAPISRAAAEAAATALQRLLDPSFPDPRPGYEGRTLPARHVRLSADTVVCFWADREDEFIDVFAPLFEVSDPQLVGDMYQSVWRGRPVAIGDTNAFYALTLSGAQGRMIVRDWFETSVGAVAANLALHFADLAVARNTPTPKGKTLPPHLPLRALLGALAPFGRSDAIPASLAADTIHAALHATPYPLSLLQRAIERARAEIGKDEWADLERRDARAALVKAVLQRRRRAGLSTGYPELTTNMDPNNLNHGYLLGRLMAILERLQQLALGDPNASVVDRYFSAASASPRIVFVRLLKNARHHARKARDEAKTSGTARWLERLMDDIADQFDPKHNGFPAYLSLEDQGLFILGYHQQRHALWSRREDRQGDEASAA
jgi:CRISPR-associated protein Csd1